VWEIPDGQRTINAVFLARPKSKAGQIIALQRRTVKNFVQLASSRDAQV
jgi:hypothetical protein